MRQFLRPRLVHNPILTFVTFHHAGGSALVYHRLAERLPEDWEILVLDLPGRGKRRRDEPIRDMRTLLDTVAGDLAPHTNHPYAIFGHSMGAVVAHETALRMTRAGRPPVWVGVSGRAAPDADWVDTQRRLSELEDDPLFTTLMELGGTPRELSEIPEFRNFFLGVTRADLQALDSYTPDRSRDRLPCPVTAYGGASDPSASPQQLVPWADETTSGFRLRLYPGGHFYFLGDTFQALAPDIAADVKSALDAELRQSPTAARSGAVSA
jgi:surfactin synthase thioesterase subunit